jgi:hypothetical protein
VAGLQEEMGRLIDSVVHDRSMLLLAETMRDGDDVARQAREEGKNAAWEAGAPGEAGGKAGVGWKGKAKAAPSVPEHAKNMGSIGMPSSLAPGAAVEAKAVDDADVDGDDDVDDGRGASKDLAEAAGVVTEKERAALHKKRLRKERQELKQQEKDLEQATARGKKEAKKAADRAKKDERKARAAVLNDPAPPKSPGPPRGPPPGPPPGAPATSPAGPSRGGGAGGGMAAAVSAADIVNRARLRIQMRNAGSPGREREGGSSS